MIGWNMYLLSNMAMFGIYVKFHGVYIGLHDSNSNKRLKNSIQRLVQDSGSEFFYGALY